MIHNRSMTQASTLQHFRHQASRPWRRATTAIADARRRRSLPGTPLLSSVTTNFSFHQHLLTNSPPPTTLTSISQPLHAMATAYQYSKLPPDSIRLLRLQPHRDPTAPIRCTLFDCPLLQNHERVTFSPYEALSYVWGSTDNPQSITVRDCPISYDDDDEPSDPTTAPARTKSAGTLSVTRNLHEALVQLRDRFIDRVLWIDAICINQADLDERSCQVASMARIYAIASRVLVWLGPAGDDGVAEALGKCVVPIRHQFPSRSVRIEEGAESSEDHEPSAEHESSDDDGSPLEDASSSEYRSRPARRHLRLLREIVRKNRSVRYNFKDLEKDSKDGPGPEDFSWLLAIFQRPWFRRIWVLQEVAAARHVLVLCGSVSIDGLALCARIDALGKEHERGGISEMRSKLQFEVNLMKDTFQRNGLAGLGLGNLPIIPAPTSQRFNLAIAPLVQLLDMYLTRQATDVRDKAYALLGICSDDLRMSGLTPDYSCPIGKFFVLLCQHLFGMAVMVVKTFGDRHVVGMRGPGRVLGAVESVRHNARLGVYKLDIGYSLEGLWSRSDIIWHVSVQTVRSGDFFFVVPGARWPMIGRYVDSSLVIIAAMARCDKLDQIDWPGTNATFWSENMNRQKRWERRQDFWSSDLWLLWDWPGTDPPTHPDSELFKGIFPSGDRSAGRKSLSVALAVIYWGLGYHVSALYATKNFLEEYRQMKEHAKNVSKETPEDDQPATFSGPKHRLEMEFGVLVSQLPEGVEKQGILGLWYLRCHLPPLCAEEEKLLLVSAAGEEGYRNKLHQFYPHRTYERNMMGQALAIRDKNNNQIHPSRPRRHSWPQFHSSWLKSPLGVESSTPNLLSPTRPTRPTGRARAKMVAPSWNDLGEECMIAIAESGNLRQRQDWLWFRLACHRQGQVIRVTPRVLNTHISNNPPAAGVFELLARLPRHVINELPIQQETFNIAVSEEGNVTRRGNEHVKVLSMVLEKRGESDKATRMVTIAERNLEVKRSVQRLDMDMYWRRLRLDVSSEPSMEGSQIEDS